MKTIEKKFAVSSHDTDGAKCGRTLTTRAIRRANKKWARNRATRLLKNDD